MPKAALADVVSCGETFVSVVEVVEALRLMGLTVGELHNAIDAGEIDRDTCNSFNPPSDAGNRAHGTTTRVLRETLIAKGWSFSNSRHFCTTISPDRAMEIVACSGNFATGNPLLAPQTKHPKGEMMLAGVAGNQHQLFFPFLARDARSSTSSPITWVLLRHRDEQLIRCELSIPTSMALDDRVVFKGTRIILPSLDLNPSGGVGSHDEGPNGIDVPVLRRRQG